MKINCVQQEVKNVSVKISESLFIGIWDLRRCKYARGLFSICHETRRCGKAAFTRLTRNSVVLFVRLEKLCLLTPGARAAGNWFPPPVMNCTRWYLCVRRTAFLIGMKYECASPQQKSRAAKCISGGGWETKEARAREARRQRFISANSEQRQSWLQDI